MLVLRHVIDPENNNNNLDAYNDIFCKSYIKTDTVKKSVRKIVTYLP